jgi:WD40 repeat protein
MNEDVVYQMADRIDNEVAIIVFVTHFYPEKVNGSNVEFKFKWMELLKTLKGRSHDVNSVFWTHDNSQIVSGSSKSMKIWDSSTGKVLKTLNDHSYRVTSVSWSHEDRRLFLVPGIKL